MCQAVEDCLVSRIGFRVFITLIGSVVFTVILINANYVLSNYSFHSDGEPIVHTPLHGLDEAVSSAVVTDIDSRHETNFVSHSRTNVLIWTDDASHFFNELSREIIHLRTSKNGCGSLQQCAFSNDKRKLTRADAVIVAAKNVSTLEQLPIFDTLTSKDISSKLWILLLHNPTYHASFLDSLGDPSKFDLLVSYLPNSTLPLAKIKFQPKDYTFGSTLTQQSVEHKPLPLKAQLPYHVQRPKRESISEHDRIVATIMDECETPGNREEYIQEMEKSGLIVQIYGHCGVPCPGHSKSDCLRHIDNHYMFYLSFDTHICQHYLSEDLWQMLSTTSSLVPVVFGGVNYVDVLPHDAYIDALNQSPLSLAQTLLFLSKNSKAYQAYLSWRNRYSLQVEEWPCFLCQTIVDRFKSKAIKSQAPVKLSSEGLCTSWPQLNFATNQH